MATDLFAVQVATQDWHPAGHASFASQHAGRQPMDRIQMYSHEQILWPDYCVQGSSGATLHPGLPWQRVTLILRKGINPAVDAACAKCFRRLARGLSIQAVCETDPQRIQ